MTNLELITGEKYPVEAKKSISRKFKLKFKSGIEIIVSEAKKLIIEKAFDNYFEAEKDAMIKIDKDTTVLVSSLIEITAVRDAGHQTSIDNMMRLADNITNSTKGKKNESISEWCKKIRKNVIRTSKHLPWIYYDRAGNACSKDESRLSIFGGYE